MANAPAASQALTVLRLLARHTEPVPASAIARDLNLPRSSVYHLLAKHGEQGFVVHLPEERRYGLGVATFELGSAYTRQAPHHRLTSETRARRVPGVGRAELEGRD